MDFTPRKAADYPDGRLAPQDGWGMRASDVEAGKLGVDWWKAMQAEATAAQAGQGATPTTQLQTIYERPQDSSVNISKDVYDQLMNNSNSPTGPERYDPEITGRGNADNMQGYSTLMQRPSRGIDFLAFARGGEMAEDVGWKHYNRNRIIAQQRQKGIDAMSQNVARDMAIKFNNRVQQRVLNKEDLGDVIVDETRKLINSREYGLSNTTVQNTLHNFLNKTHTNAMAGYEKAQQWDRARKLSEDLGLPYNPYKAVGATGNPAALTEYLNKFIPGGKFRTSKTGGQILPNGQEIDSGRVLQAIYAANGDAGAAIASLTGEQGTYNLGRARTKAEEDEADNRAVKQQAIKEEVAKRNNIIFTQQNEAVGLAPKGSTEKLRKAYYPDKTEAATKTDETKKLSDAAKVENINNGIKDAKVLEESDGGRLLKDDDKSLDLAMLDKFIKQGNEAAVQAMADNGITLPLRANVDFLTEDAIKKISNGDPVAEGAYRAMLEADGDVLKAKKTFEAKFPDEQFFFYWLKGYGMKADGGTSKKAKAAAKAEDDKQKAKNSGSKAFKK